MFVQEMALFLQENAFFSRKTHVFCSLLQVVKHHER